MLWFRRINLLSIALCLGVIVLGAFVRLSDAGLGCPDWPGCYGHIGVPQAEHDVARAEARFPERPVEAPKAWKEMVHRYFASTLGLLIVALAVMSRFQPAVPRRLPWFLVGLVIFQGILGMWTVTWQLKPLVVTAHLFGGLATFAGLLWLWLSVRSRHEEMPPLVAPPRLRRYAGVAMVLLMLQIFLGGWTSTNYAALACPDLPTCHGSYWPETDIPTAFTLWHGLGINYEYGILDARARVTIHHFHRMGAIVLSVALLLLGGWLLRRGDAPLWRGLGAALIAALAIQVTIGLSIVKLQLPLGLATAHNAGAALLVAVLVTLNHYAWTRRPPT